MGCEKVNESHSIALFALRQVGQSANIGVAASSSINSVDINLIMDPSFNRHANNLI